MSFIEHYFGSNTVGDPSPYLTRVHLTPMTRWGQLRFHIFYRGDNDSDPHDHTADFWTFPLNYRGYTEEVWTDKGFSAHRLVRGWRWTFREATYSHRIVGPMEIYVKSFGTGYNKGKAKILRVSQRKSLFTLVWVKPPYRKWGFWVKDFDRKLIPKFLREERRDRIWVPWASYLFNHDNMVLDDFNWKRLQ